MASLAVGIYLFDGVEVLDFAGPFEVFSTASRVARRDHPVSKELFDVLTIGVAESITTRGGLIVKPAATIGKHPNIDVLIIPGGDVAAEVAKSDVVSWIASQSTMTQITASICTGAFLLGQAGLLVGKRVTTHWEDINELRRLLPDTIVEAGVRWIDEGAIVTSAGISAGIDMSLHLVARLATPQLAIQTALQMEYVMTKKTPL